MLAFLFLFTTFTFGTKSGFVKTETIKVRFDPYYNSISFESTNSGAPIKYLINDVEHTLATNVNYPIQITQDGISYLSLSDKGNFINTSSYYRSDDRIPVATIIRNNGELIQIINDIHGYEMSPASKIKSHCSGPWLRNFGGVYLGFEQESVFPYKVHQGILVNEDNDIFLDATTLASVISSTGNNDFSLMEPSNVWFTNCNSIKQGAQGLETLPSGRTSALIRVLCPDLRGEGYTHLVVPTTLDIDSNEPFEVKLRHAQEHIKSTVHTFYQELINEWNVTSVMLYTSGNSEVDTIIDLRGLDNIAVFNTEWYTSFITPSSATGTTPVDSDGWQIIHTKEITEPSQSGEIVRYNVAVEQYKMVKIMATYHSLSNNVDSKGFVRFRVKKSNGQLVTGPNYFNIIRNTFATGSGVERDWSCAGFVVGKAGNNIDFSNTDLSQLGGEVASGIGEITLQTKASSNGDKNLTWRGNCSYETDGASEGMIDIGGHLEMNIDSHISEVEILIKQPRDVTKVWVMGIK